MGVGRWARAAAVLAVTTVVAAVTGCSTEPGPRPVSMQEGRPAAAATPDARAARAAESALSAYAGYLSTSRDAARVPDPQHPGLRNYLADPLLTRVRLTIRDLKLHGAVRIGAMSSNPTVTDMSLDAEPATVTIQDCLDTTGYRMIYAKTRAPVPGSGGGRYVATATATRYPDGRWLISDGTAHTDQPC
jgi:hypothetical protein